MANLITGIISITISAVILSAVFISTLKGVSTTPCTNLTLGCGHQNWSVGEISVWGLLTLIGIVGLLYGVLNIFGLA